MVITTAVYFIRSLLSQTFGRGRSCLPLFRSTRPVRLPFPYRSLYTYRKRPDNRERRQSMLPSPLPFSLLLTPRHEAAIGFLLKKIRWKCAKSVWDDTAESAPKFSLLLELH